MPETAPPSLRKTVVFAALVATMLVGAAAMSLYKIAIANSYVTQAVPLNPNAPVRPERFDIDRGAHLADLVGCADCHGTNYAGTTLVDRPGYATVIAPNLTSGQGGRGRVMDDNQLRRALQAGLDGEDRVLWGMPRHSLNALAQDDVWALVGYLRALPPIDRQARQNRLDFWGYIDVAVRGLNLIDRTHLPLMPPKVAPSSVSLDNAASAFGNEPKVYAAWRLQAPKPTDADFGAYVRAIGNCSACHGNTSPVVGRITAPPLDGAKQDVSRCKVGRRLVHLTSEERAAMFIP